MKIHKRIIRFMLMAVVTAFAVWCCEEPTQVVDDSLSISLRSSKASNKSGSTFVSVKASGSWTLELLFEDGQAPWAELSTTFGTGENNGVILSYKVNNIEKARTLSIIARNSTKSAVCSFTQAAADPRPQRPDDTNSSETAVPTWLELPATRDNDGLDLYWHHQVINGEEIRSFSFDYDPEARLSHWVAYPLNKTLIGGGSRTDEWGFDPKVPQEQQPNLQKGFKSQSGIRYDRGHQLPSADRYNYDANVQTFYFTNMTPQRNDFNGYAWADLETKVRDWSRAVDTLYVVTGCTIKGSTDYALDNNGNKVTVPTAYFKALLGYKKAGTIGITSQTGGYTALGFWYEHEPYSGEVMDRALTIAELEEQTGFDFFVNLKSKIGQELYEKVETTKDGWWK